MEVKIVSVVGESTGLAQLSIFYLMFMLHRSFFRVTVSGKRQNVPATSSDRRFYVVPGCVATQPAGLLFRGFREGLSCQVVGWERR